jgi:hypothetical protein
MELNESEDYTEYYRMLLHAGVFSGIYAVGLPLSYLEPRIYRICPTPDD